MDTPFYNDGLSFECTRCSKCCRHDPGYVFLTMKDLLQLSDKLGTTKKEFISKYCKRVDLGGFARISLIEKPNNDCIFWENGGCLVYESRPVQCKTYPFWSSVLDSREDWEALGKNCPGVNRGKLYTKEEIEEKLNQRKRDPMINPDDL